MKRRVVAVLVAAGRSERMGNDKLWIDFHGRPVWRWSLDALLAVPQVRRVAIVVPPEREAEYRAALPSTSIDRCLTVAGGAIRAHSVLAGLEALRASGAPDDATILVHDAARPAATPALVARVIAAQRDDDAIVPVIAIHDSLKRIEDGRAEAAISRAGVVAAQTPQAGRLGRLREALVAAHAAEADITDDVGALAVLGVPVRTVEGEVENHKLTIPADESLLRAILRERAVPLDAPVVDRPGARAGIGFDAHRLEEGRRLRLGGVEWPDQARGLAGHSDGDVALHAVIDALLGAAGLGDIGSLFPAGDEAWRNADSGDLLVRAAAAVREAGWVIVSVDLAVIAALPAIAPRRSEIQRRLAELAGIGPAQVTVKGTTSDGLGVTGGDGIAAQAVAVVRPADPTPRFDA